MSFCTWSISCKHPLKKSIVKSGAVRFKYTHVSHRWDFKCLVATLDSPGGSVGKNLPANEGDVGSIPGSERSPEKGNGNPLQYSRLKNPMDNGAWQAIVHGVARESNMTVIKHQGITYFWIYSHHTWTYTFVSQPSWNNGKNQDSD